MMSQTFTWDGSSAAWASNHWGDPYSGTPRWPGDAGWDAGDSVQIAGDVFPTGAPLATVHCEALTVDTSTFGDDYSVPASLVCDGPLTIVGTTTKTVTINSDVGGAIGLTDGNLASGNGVTFHGNISGGENYTFGDNCTFDGMTAAGGGDYWTGICIGPEDGRPTGEIVFGTGCHFIRARVNADHNIAIGSGFTLSGRFAFVAGRDASGDLTVNLAVGEKVRLWPESTTARSEDTRAVFALIGTGTLTISGGAGSAFVADAVTPDWPSVAPLLVGSGEGQSIVNANTALGVGKNDLLVPLMPGFTRIVGVAPVPAGAPLII